MRHLLFVMICAVTAYFIYSLMIFKVIQKFLFMIQTNFYLQEESLWLLITKTFTVTSEQNEDRQLIAMKEFCIPFKNIFIDKQSGKDFNRPIYIELVQKLKPNDTLVVKSIDQLGRNFYDIFE